MIFHASLTDITQLKFSFYHCVLLMLMMACFDTTIRIFLALEIMYDPSRMDNTHKLSYVSLNVVIYFLSPCGDCDGQFIYGRSCTSLWLTFSLVEL